MRRGFTLIELLVVVAIIALLLAILIPSLAQARERGRATVCLSNLKQLIAGFHIYAHEDKAIPGTYWQGPINLDWGGRNNASYNSNPAAFAHPFETSVLHRYVGGALKILECPTGQREANTFYDYTAVIRLAGARTDLPWHMTWLADPANANSIPIRFPAVPLLVEEDFYFYNQQVDDGSFANLDQITDRHSGGSNLAYLNGTAGRWKPPKGPNPEVAETRDLTCKSLRLWAKDKAYTVWASSNKEFGWANNPK